MEQYTFALSQSCITFFFDDDKGAGSYSLLWYDALSKIKTEFRGNLWIRFCSSHNSYDVNLHLFDVIYIPIVHWGWNLNCSQLIPLSVVDLPLCRQSMNRAQYEAMHINFVSINYRLALVSIYFNAL